MILKTTQVNVGAQGHVFAPTSGALGVRIANRSRFNSLVIYLDGIPADESERFYGPNREHMVVPPHGWATMPIGPLAVSPDGRLAGDPIPAYPVAGALYADDVPAVITEFDQYLPPDTWEPERVTLARWPVKGVVVGAAKTVAITFDQLDPSFRLPQVRDRAIGLRMFLGTGSTGADGFQRLHAIHRYIGSSNYDSIEVPVGGYVNGIEAFDEQLTAWIKPERLSGLFLYTTETGSRQTAGELFLQNRPVNFKEKNKRIAAAVGELSDHTIVGARPTHGLSEIRVAYYDAGGGGGSIIAEHYTHLGRLLFTETHTTLAGAGKTVGFEPGGDFIALKVVIGGALTYDVFEDRELVL